MDPSDDTLRLLCRSISFLTPDLVVAPPSWLGHVPFAFWIVDATRPSTLVELGTHTGNSYSAFCQAVKVLGQPSACFAVDTWEGDSQAGYYGDEIHRTLSDFHDPRYGGFSRLMRMTFDEAAGHFADGSIDLLHIDGLHTYEAVRHDFETWRPKLSPRGVVLFHDVNVRKDDFGVWRLWEELSALHPHFTFLHSNGLGVLGVGEEIPEAARRLFEIQEENGARLATTRGFFDRLGQGVVDAQRTRQLTDEGDALRADAADLRRTIDRRVDDLRASMTAVAERDQSIITLQSWLAERDQSVAALRSGLAERDTTVAERDQSIATLQSWLAERDSAIVEFNATIAENESTLAAMRGTMSVLRVEAEMLRNVLASTSWKMTAPVRAVGRAARRLRRFVGSRHHMTVRPMSDVVVSGDAFESTGWDPAFLLVSDRGRAPTGICLLSLRARETDPPLLPVLYVDSGAGFGEAGAITLPLATDGLIETLIVLPADTRALRLDPTDRPARFAIDDVTITEIGKLGVLARAVAGYRDRPGELLRLPLRHRSPSALKNALMTSLSRDLPPRERALDYAAWVRLYDTVTPNDRAAMAARPPSARPLISIVMPVYNPPEVHLRRALDTVLDQTYPHWELCVADDASTRPHVATVLAEYAARDSRVKVVKRETNGHISAASNTALDLATGEFVALMDHDDELPPHALYEVAAEIGRHPDVDILFSDEDKIDEEGRRYDPYFKSDWNPDRFLGQNMVSHLGVFRRSILREIGGFRVGYEGSQDYDLALRAAERTEAARIRHIPMILYHWRVFSSSASFSTTALPTATDAARRALRDHFDRIGTNARVDPAPGAEWYSRIVHPLPDPAPSVSLLVPTRDKLDLLRQCVEGLLNETDYPNLEVLILDNNSEKRETLEYFAALEKRDRVRVLRCDGPFNFSAINNAGVAAAKGEIVGLINNDIKVIEPNWLREMVSHAVRPEVGAVGAKLYYGDDTIQHAGVVTGIMGVANHVHKHLPRAHPGHFGRLRLTQNVSVVTAACLLLRKSVFEEVGGLDVENLAVAFNDVDFCLRLREKGYLIVWTPHAELYHLESASRGDDLAPDKIERFRREIRFMCERWGEALRRDPYYNPNLTLDAEDMGLAFPPRVEKTWVSTSASVKES